MDPSFFEDRRPRAGTDDGKKMTAKAAEGSEGSADAVTEESGEIWG